MLSLMTSTSPVSASLRPPRAADAPSGEVGPGSRPARSGVAASTPTGAAPGGIWFLAGCDRCDPDLDQPFSVQADRDQWAMAHVVATHHTVRLTVDGVAPESHLSVVIRYRSNPAVTGRPVAGGTYAWLCPAPDADCVRWHGPYETPQLALADWRGHSGVSVR